MPKLVQPTNILVEAPTTSQTDSNILQNIRWGRPWMPYRPGAGSGVVALRGVAQTVSKVQAQLGALGTAVAPGATSPNAAKSVKAITGSVGVNPAGGAPKDVFSVSAVQEGYIEQAKTVSLVTVTFGRNYADSNFDHVNVWVYGYQGSKVWTLYCNSLDSPATFVLESTGATVRVAVQAVSASGVGSHAPANCPAANVTLSGVTSNPPAPTVAANLSGTPVGYEFVFDQVQLAAGVQDVIQQYRVYRNTSANTFAGSSLVHTYQHSSTNDGLSILFQDRVGGGKTYYYFVTSVNTKGLESSSTAAQSGAVTSGTASLDSDVGDGSTYIRVASVNADHTFHVSTPLLNQGLNSGSKVSDLTYTSTTTSINWSWGSKTAYCWDGNNISINSGSHNFTGLSSNTTYYFAANVNVSNNTLTMYNAGTSTPAESTIQQTYNADGNSMLMYAQAATTPVSGSGSGGGPSIGARTRI